MLRRYFLTSWVITCSLVGLWVAYWGNQDHEGVIYATYAVLVVTGCGLGAYRTARLEGEGEIRVLSGGLAFIMLILTARGLFFLPYVLDPPANEVNTWFTTVSNFLNGGAICAVASFGALLYFDLAPGRGGKVLASYMRVNPLRLKQRGRKRPMFSKYRRTQREQRKPPKKLETRA